LGYSKGYQHAHQHEGALTDMECLPPSQIGKRFYHPSDRGLEKRVEERLAEIRRWKAEHRRQQEP
jgi:putative ATPase